MLIDEFFKLITWAGSLFLLLPAAVIISLLLVRSQRLAEGVLLLGGLIGVSLISHVLKIVIARPRPAAEKLLVTMPADFSFPSAHTSQIVAFTGAVLLIVGTSIDDRRAVLIAWLAATAIVFLVGYSRVYLQVHYLSDVLAGGLLGAVWICALAHFSGVFRF